MTQIPRAALLLGLAGLIPFLWSAASLYVPPLADPVLRTLGSRFTGPYVIVTYGTIILAFMSGVLWGFATKAHGTAAAIGYTLSVIPALWAFFFVGGGTVSSATNLLAGFIGLLALDWVFWKQGLAPAWWMRLRLILTSVVALCLLAVIA